MDLFKHQSKETTEVLFSIKGYWLKFGMFLFLILFTILLYTITIKTFEVSKSFNLEKKIELKQALQLIEKTKKCSSNKIKINNVLLSKSEKQNDIDKIFNTKKKVEISVEKCVFHILF